MFTAPVWAGFLVFIAVVLAVDLGLLNRQPKEQTLKSIALMTGFWVLIAFLFSIIIYTRAGHEKAMEFATGYLVELSLSVDNVFVFVLLFNYFQVEQRVQHRVLFWGIIGAIILRFIMISCGVYLAHRFQWIFYIFGIFLIYSAYRIVFAEEESTDVSGNKLITFLKKHFQFTDQYHGDKFMIIENGKRLFTPLFLVVLLVEQADLVFAMDSIPAILAITQDEFIVFTSNIFAILGLRSLYFLLARVVHQFEYLKYGLAVILAYIGIKMILLVHGAHISTILSLFVIIASLAASIILSILKQRSKV